MTSLEIFVQTKLLKNDVIAIFNRPLSHCDDQSCPREYAKGGFGGSNPPHWSID